MKAIFRAAPYLCCALMVLSFPLAGQAQTSLGTDETAEGEDELIERTLRLRGSIHFQEQPLREVVSQLSGQFGLQIILAAKKLEEASVSPDAPVTKDLENLPLESMLRIMLKELELTLVIRDHVLVITTPEDAESQLVTRVYPILDLLGQQPTRQRRVRPELPADYETVIDVITDIFAPQSWDNVGGPGAIEALDNPGVLIISQTRDVHREVENLLATLRRVKSLQFVSSGPVGTISRPADPLPTVNVPRPYSSLSPGAWQMPQVHPAAH